MKRKGNWKRFLAVLTAVVMLAGQTPVYAVSSEDTVSAEDAAAEVQDSKENFSEDTGEAVQAQQDSEDETGGAERSL